MGELFRALFEFQIKRSLPTAKSGILMAFQFFKNQFDFDENKYIRTCDKNRENGLKGAQAKRHKRTKRPLPTATDRLPTVANQANKNKDIKEEEIYKEENSLKKLVSLLLPYLL